MRNRSNLTSKHYVITGIAATRPKTRWLLLSKFRLQTPQRPNLLRYTLFQLPSSVSSTFTNRQKTQVALIMKCVCFNNDLNVEFISIFAIDSENRPHNQCRKLVTPLNLNLSLETIYWSVSSAQK